MSHKASFRAAAVAVTVVAAALWSCRTANAGPRPVAVLADALQTGIALYQQGKYAEAEATLRGAQGTEASAYLAASLAKQKKYGEAEAPANAALAASATHPIAVAALGESLVGQKKYDDAVDRLEAIVKQKDDIAYAHYWLGHAYYNKKQIDRMARNFDRFLQLAPQAPEAPAVQQILASVR